MLGKLFVAPGSSNLLAFKPGAKGELRPDVEYQQVKPGPTSQRVSHSECRAVKAFTPFGASFAHLNLKITSQNTSKPNFW